MGLRYNAPDLDGSSSGDQQRRRSGRWASLTLAAASSPFDGARIVDMRSEWQAVRLGRGGGAVHAQGLQAETREGGSATLPHTLCCSDDNSTQFCFQKLKARVTDLHIA